MDTGAGLVRVKGCIFILPQTGGCMQSALRRPVHLSWALIPAPGQPWPMETTIIPRFYGSRFLLEEKSIPGKSIQVKGSQGMGQIVEANMWLKFSLQWHEL
jgi:hypothetical protein